MTEQAKHTYHAIGIMSGSSLDGLDLAYCRFVKISDHQWDFKLLHKGTAELGAWKEKLKTATGLTNEQLGELSRAFATYLAQEVLAFIERNNIDELDLIASHGHTIYHYPAKGVTCQIGDGQVLANLIGHTVVSNLRQKDMDFGGQGAPIVPIGDKYLFSPYTYCLNLGGIANISVKKGEELLAYDICVANQVLNQLAGQKEMSFDKDGLLARKGKCNEALLQALNNLSYYRQSPPKSLDNSYTQEVMTLIDSFDLNVLDTLSTYTEHIAYQIAQNIAELQDEADQLDSPQMLITGGGAHNSYLVERIEALAQIGIILPSKDIIDFKEAIVMGLIGVLRLRDEVNVLSSVTGANQDTSCGEVFLPR